MVQPFLVETVIAKGEGTLEPLHGKECVCVCVCVQLFTAYFVF